ncbi:hypothetical protein KIW84_041665 [Lathyrus oleraceus]|uniref:Uncharacterized protein n=1 Tax=Pisum sativum TaxID=3888 RepID=A0A9D4X962_PEA|nr:hypothetical protein KIW84_041665 [Pisum sativum]
MMARQKGALEYPKHLGAKGLYKLFEEFGEIDEVVIPPKRDKRGRKYKFIRFLEVFFSKGKDKAKSYRGGSSFATNQVKLPTHNNSSGRFSRGRSYADTTHNSSNLYGDFSFSPKPSLQLAFDVAKEEMKMFEKSYVGKVLYPRSMYNMQRIFHSEGYFKLKVTPLGANIFLLEEYVKGELKALVGKYVRYDACVFDFSKMDVTCIMVRTSCDKASKEKGVLAVEKQVVCLDVEVLGTSSIVSSVTVGATDPKLLEAGVKSNVLVGPCLP